MISVVVVILLIALALLVGLGLLVSVAARSLSKCSPAVAFSVLGVVFALLLALVLSIPMLRYRSACRNLGSTQHYQSAFYYLIHTKGILQAFDLALARGSENMRASLPHYVEETYEGKWAMLDGKERQRITADQGMKIIVRCLGDPNAKVAFNAAEYLDGSPLVTPQNVQAIIPYLNRDFRPASNFNVLWWIVKRPGLAPAVPDREISNGLAGRYADDAFGVFYTKYCRNSGGYVVMRPGARNAILLDALASPNRDVQMSACFQLHNFFKQAIPAAPNGSIPLLGNRAFEKKLGIPSDLLQSKLRQFLRAPGTVKLDSYARKWVEEMLYYLTGEKG